MSNPYKTIYELRETIAELSERCREQEADIEELLKEREWISVKDALPHAGDYVMVYTTYVPSTKKPGIDTDHFTDEYEFRFYHESVTHWMPLPEKPESEDDAE